MAIFKDLEQGLTSTTLAIVIATALFDYHDDWSQGATIANLLLDTLVNIFIAGTLLYILKQRPRATHARNRHLEQVIHYSDEDLKRWKSKASDLLKGLGAKIDEQLEHWNLSLAEKEIALFLVKGMSLKEIAALRNTSEKTVRQQASQIYAKAQLENRAELAAFFLEDLLLPE